MSITIHWVVPDNLDCNSTYQINIYESQTTEDGDYTKIATIDALSSGSQVNSYEVSSGDRNYYYYVRYFVSPNGSESGRVLAWIELTVKEQRLTERVYRNLPRDITVNFGNDNRETRDAIYAALQAINAIPPQTSYTMTNVPVIWEAPIVLGATMFIFLQGYLNIAIKDFSYSDNGLSLNRDRGAKVNAAIKQVLDVYNDWIKAVKFADYPDPLGLGSYAIAFPQARVLSFLYNIREAY